jgi:hypothetical protein
MKHLNDCAYPNEVVKYFEDTSHAMAAFHATQQDCLELRVQMASDQCNLLSMCFIRLCEITEVR